MADISRMAFGGTGHESTRIIFGAAVFYALKQERADQILELLLAYGVNHIDAAAIYGDAELRIGGWMPRYRDRFFLATKTGERTADGAMGSIERSLERMRVDHVDLIQLHNLTDEAEWQTAMGPGGALEAAMAAKEKGLARFIGVTGHGIQAPRMHLRSLEQFDFDSVLLPYNYMMMQDENYAADFEKLISVCEERRVAVQTIKAIARRRWREGDTQRHFSWYEPIQDPDVLRRTVGWVLSRPGLFLNTSSDARLLPAILESAAAFEDGTEDIGEGRMAADAELLGMKPIFAAGMPEPF